MKKLFLLLAFTGIVGAASASTIVSHAKGTVITLGDEKKKKDKKACSEKDATTKSCSKESKKSCCKHKGEAKAETTSSAAPVQK